MLAFEPLYEERTVLVVPLSHRLAGRKVVRLVALHGQRMLLPISPGYRLLLEGYLRSANITPEVVLDLGSFASLPTLVQALNLVAIVPQHAVPEIAGCRAIPMAGNSPVRTPPIHLKRRQVHSAEVRALAAAGLRASANGQADRRTRVIHR